MKKTIDNKKTKQHKLSYKLQTNDPRIEKTA